MVLLLLLLLLLAVVPLEAEAEEEERRVVRFRRPPPLREAVARALERRAWRWERGGSCSCADAEERRLAAAGRRPGCRRKDKRVMAGLFVRLFRPALSFLPCCRGMRVDIDGEGEEDENEMGEGTIHNVCGGVPLSNRKTFNSVCLSLAEQHSTHKPPW
jgi:hypothetical protein